MSALRLAEERGDVSLVETVETAEREEVADSEVRLDSLRDIGTLAIRFSPLDDDALDDVRECMIGRPLPNDELSALDGKTC